MSDRFQMISVVGEKGESMYDINTLRTYSLLGTYGMSDNCAYRILDKSNSE